MSSFTTRVVAPGPARLPGDDAKPAISAEVQTRSFGRALLLALPAITLVTLQLWAAVAIFTYIVWFMLGGSTIAGAVAGVAASVPGVFATWHIVRLAVAAERQES